MNRATLVREKVTRLVKLLTEKRVTVTQRGSKAYVEYNRDGSPRVVNIPYIPDDASEEYLGAIEGFLDHEVAHVLFTDYKALERAKKAGIGQLHNIIEDAFIEKKMAAHFNGSGVNLRNVGEFFLKSFTDKKIKEDKKNILGYLMMPAIRAWSGQTVFVDYMKDKWDMLGKTGDKINEYASKTLPNITTSDEGVDAAIEIKRLLELPDETPEEGEPSDDEGDSSGKSKGKKSKSAKKDKAPKSEAKSDPAPEGTESESGEEGDPTEGDGSGDGDDGEEGDGDSPLDKKDDGDEPLEDGDVPDSHGGDSDTLPDESSKESKHWKEIEDKLGDFDKDLAEALSGKAEEEGRSAEYLIFTKDDDKIEPLETEAGTRLDASLKNMQDKVDHMVGPLQKDVERAIASKSRSILTGGHRSGKLHAAALSRLTSFGDERVFRRKHEATTKDVAVGLLIDCSGSMSRHGKIQTASFAAYGLASVLERINIPYEVLGFTTSYNYIESDADAYSGKYARSLPLYMPIIKGFNERLSIENKKRFAALSFADWLCENVDGECVQIAASRLSQRKEKRKILIVLSDGQPACPGNGVMQERHLKKVVKEAGRQGVEVLGIGIQDASVQQYYPKHVVLSSVADLPTEVIGQIKRMLMQ